jgi:hypothetical protein
LESRRGHQFSVPHTHSHTKASAKGAVKTGARPTSFDRPTSKKAIMGIYENIDIDFAKRTLRIIEQYDQNKQPGPENYEVRF